MISLVNVNKSEEQFLVMLVPVLRTLYRPDVYLGPYQTSLIEFSCENSQQLFATSERKLIIG